MIKKIVLSVAVLGLLGGGFFYWWNNQTDVRELNKTLPKGVKVAKSLFGNEYSVVNKIDNYSFKVPAEWKGVKEIEYIQNRQVDDYNVASVGVKGLSGSGTILSLDVYSGIQPDINLEQWAANLFSKFELTGEFKKQDMGIFPVVKVKEEEHLGGTYVYFLKNNSKIYVINGGSEEFIKEIILNGKW